MTPAMATAILCAIFELVLGHPFAARPDLEAQAQDKAARMAAADKLEHDAEHPGTGEVVAVALAPTAPEAALVGIGLAYLRSPEHRAVLEVSNGIGCAVAVSASQAVYSACRTVR